MDGLNEIQRRRGRWMATGLLAIGLILGVASLASAQGQGGWKTTGWIGYEGQANTDLDLGSSDFDFWLINTGLKSKTMLSDTVGLSLGGDYRAVGYNFSGGVIGTPWATVHVARFNPGLTYMLNDKWSLIGGASFEISAENGADVGDSLTGGGIAGVGYKWSDSLSIALGVIVNSQIEDSARIQPFVLINWGFTDNLALTMEASNSRGGEIQLSYALGDHWEVGVGAGFRRERFRLDDKGVALYRDGVGEEESTVVNLRVTYKISETLALEGYGGTTVDGEFKLQDKDGNNTIKSDYDNSGYGGFRIKFAY